MTNIKKSILLFIVLIFFIASCRNNVTDPNNDEVVEKPHVVISLKKIEYPSERVIWRQGEQHDIKWQVTPKLENVKIVLLRKFAEVHTIAELVPNNGYYRWHIPRDLPSSHHYRIRLISPEINSVHTTSVEFQILEAENNPVTE